MQIASRSCALVSVLDTKTESFQITGVPAEGPGSSAAHLTFSVGENFTGRLVAGDEPLNSGPRQFGHSCAAAPVTVRTNNTEVSPATFRIFSNPPVYEQRGD